MIKHQVETARYLIRVKPSRWMSDLDVPWVWGTILAVTSKMEEMESSLLDAGAKNILLGSTARMSETADRLKTILVLSILLVKESLLSDAHGIDSLKEDTFLMPPLGNLGSQLSHKSSWADEVIKKFEWKVVEAMNNRLNRILIKSNRACIQLSGLGLDTLPKAIAWLAENFPNHKFGLIVDPHMMEEHIQSSISGEECLPKMGNKGII
jgi:hypothetical protein